METLGKPAWRCWQLKQKCFHLSKPSRSAGQVHSVIMGWWERGIVEQFVRVHVMRFLTVLSLLGGQESKAAGLLLPFKSIGGKNLSSRHTEMDKKHIPTLKVRGVVKDHTASVNHPQGAAAKNDIFSGYPAGSTHLSKSLSALQSGFKGYAFPLDIAEDDTCCVWICLFPSHVVGERL